MLTADAPAGASEWDVVNITRLMELTAGRPEVIIGLVDGPVAAEHPDLATDHIRHIRVPSSKYRIVQNGAARAHATYLAGILTARRGSAAPAICSGCSLLVRPIFLDLASMADVPSATPDELADAIVECVQEGARILNLSVAVGQPSPNREHRLEEALSHAANRSVIVVASAGNQGTLGSSAITRHPWVVPVAACDRRGSPLPISNIGTSIGRRGLMAPGEGITSLGLDGRPVTSGGTSASAPFVTGAIALLWSLFPDASAAELKLAVTRPDVHRATVVPPVLDAWAAYQLIAHQRGYG